jgi:Mrp family chromosome partitioning ATPase
MSDAPRYATLRDYLRVVRAHRLLIVLAIVMFGGAAFALSARQDEEYEASASLAFKEETQDLDLLGASVAPNESPTQRAAIAAKTINRETIAERVRKDLKLSTPAPVLASAISAQVEVNTNLVVITARGGNPEFVARLVNGFARAQQAVARRDSRERFGDAADDLAERTLEPTRTNSLARSLERERIQRLRFLEQTAEPVEVISLAVRPTEPVAPQPVRNTALGVIVGLTLGLLAAFTRSALDRRLHGARDIQEQFQWPVVGHIREDALGRTTTVASNGRRALEEADLESFRILRANLQFLDVDNPPRSIVVTSPLPAEGKTTVSAALACTSALAGKLTLLVECDLRRPAIAERLGLEAAPGLSDYIIGDADPSDILQTVPVGEGASRNGEDADAGDANDATANLVCITAGRPTAHPAELLGSQRFRDFLAGVTEAYDLVVIDSSPLLSVVDTIEMLSYVQGVLVCVRATQTTREQALAAKQAIERVPPRPTGVVVTGVRPGDEVDYGYYSYAYAYGPAAG